VRFLLDTCLLSEATRPSPAPRVMQWLSEVEETKTFLSAITIGELAQGIAQLPNGRKRNRLSEWLHDDLLLRFTGRTLAIDAAVMLAWGELVAGLRAKGRVLPILDSLIAATAVHHGLTVVTRNTADFGGAGVKTFYPWGES